MKILSKEERLAKELQKLRKKRLKEEGRARLVRLKQKELERIKKAKSTQAKASKLKSLQKLLKSTKPHTYKKRKTYSNEFDLLGSLDFFEGSKKKRKKNQIEWL